MAEKNQELGFDMTLVYASPLGELTHVKPTGNFYEATPTRYPRIFQRDPALLKLYKDIEHNPTRSGRAWGGRALGTLVYLTELLSLDDLLDRYERDFDPRALLLKLFRAFHTGETAIEGDIYHGSRVYVGDISEELKASMEPDLQYGYWPIFRQPDHAIETFFALRLADQRVVDPNTQTPISTYQEIETLVKNTSDIEKFRGRLTFPHRIDSGFSSLVRETTINKLLQRGIVSEDGLDKFFLSVADWKLMLMRHFYSHTTRSMILSPYPTEDPEAYPDIRFLPYIGIIFLISLSELPDLNPHEGELGVHDIQNAVNHLYQFSEKVLSSDLLHRDATYRNSVLANRVTSVHEQMQAIMPYFVQFIEIYKQMPQLLNKREKIQPPKSQIAEFEDIRQKILDSGAGNNSRVAQFFRTRRSVMERI